MYIFTQNAEFYTQNAALAAVLLSALPVRSISGRVGSI